jgi:hypothetical protein
VPLWTSPPRSSMSSLAKFLARPVRLRLQKSDCDGLMSTTERIRHRLKGDQAGGAGADSLRVITHIRTDVPYAVTGPDFDQQ